MVRQFYRRLTIDDHTACTNGASAFPAVRYLYIYAPESMDAPEEKDVKLQRASENLLSELRSRLPSFLKKKKKKTSSPNEDQNQAVRRRVGRSDTDSLIQLVRKVVSGFDLSQIR